jgi:hypothetical protein
MKRARIIRPQRAPVFIGCEGQSEVGYCGWLRNLVRDRNLPFHLELADLGRGAGDPFARVDMAIERIARLERNRERFIGRYLFLDTDQLAADPDRANRARGRAQVCGLIIIWQNPTHEAFLLRHFPGRDTRQPPDKRSADTALARVWADYRKPCGAQDIERRLGLDDALRVAGHLPELADLLRLIGLHEG